MIGEAIEQVKKTNPRQMSIVVNFKSSIEHIFFYIYFLKNC